MGAISNWPSFRTQIQQSSNSPRQLERFDLPWPTNTILGIGDMSDNRACNHSTKWTLTRGPQTHKGGTLDEQKQRQTSNNKLRLIARSQMPSYIDMLHRQQALTCSLMRPIAERLTSWSTTWTPEIPLNKTIYIENRVYWLLTLFVSHRTRKASVVWGKGLGSYGHHSCHMPYGGARRHDDVDNNPIKGLEVISFILWQLNKWEIGFKLGKHANSPNVSSRNSAAETPECCCLSANQSQSGSTE